MLCGISQHTSSIPKELYVDLDLESSLMCGTSGCYRRDSMLLARLSSINSSTCVFVVANVMLKQISMYLFPEQTGGKTGDSN